MRDGGLVDRLDRAVADGDREVVKIVQLNAVARALRQVTERTGRSIGKERAAIAAALKPLAPAEFEPEMPQILQHPSTLKDDKSMEAGGRTHGNVVAPAILVLSLLAVAVLMTASFADLSRLPGLAFLDDKPRPRLAAPIRQSASLMAPIDAGMAVTIIGEPSMPVAPALSLDELALLERCESLIAAGDMQAARKELAVAASGGSINARFALAETFDPNVLAAWGLRERVADPGTARTLYEQVLEAGDKRASARIAALGGTR